MQHRPNSMTPQPGLVPNADERRRSGTYVPKLLPNGKVNFVGLRVLLVDQNMFERRVVAQIARAFEIRNIIDLADGHEALNMMRSQRFDLVFCDFTLRGMSGLEFARNIRSDAAVLDRQVPIVLLTNQTQYAKIVAARDSGVTEIVAKPVSPKLLQERITYVFQQPRPFVEAASYVGPSRRRRDANFNGDDRRGFGAPPPEHDDIGENF
jgi:two-component system chemotaxis response regulator CheY